MAIAKSGVDSVIDSFGGVITYIVIFKFTLGSQENSYEWIHKPSKYYQICFRNCDSNIFISTLKSTIDAIEIAVQ